MKGNFHVQFRSSRRESNLSSDCDYSSHDQRFVENLYRDLRKAGVLCWYAPESLNAGEKFPAEITEAVQSREKLIVVLSKYSLGAIFGSSAHLRDVMCPQ